MEITVEKIANALSTLTILSCVFLKVPQILQIKRRKSAEGIYMQSMVMEIAGFSIMSLYNYTNDYNVMTYLEYPIILVQVYVLLYYVLRYQRLLDTTIVPMAVGSYVIIVLSFMLGFLPKKILRILVPFCTPLSGFAKVTYIYGIAMTGNADAVSLTTWMISIGTNLARIFTVWADSADTSLIINFIISTLLSTAVLITALYYQNTSCVCNDRARRIAKAHRMHPHFD
ncbi:unnamed protein product [Arctia plantaginis]|uniref:PQ-loop repeat-containing protein 3 n=1 Tax=Arctia plantaginis TaxID=874455 RepID=A0A8S0Z238_ARCPL|nr:unnamed protein product [Arctia plantaginis]